MGTGGPGKGEKTVDGHPSQATWTAKIERTMFPAMAFPEETPHPLPTAIHDRNLTRFPTRLPALHSLASNPTVTFTPDSKLWWPSYSARTRSGLFSGTDFFYGTGETFQYRTFLPTQKQENYYLVGLIYFAHSTEGAPQCVHGGAIGTALDQLLAIAVHSDPANKHVPHMTLTLTVDYRRPVPLAQVLGFHCGITKREGRKVFVEGCVFDVGNKGGQGGMDLATYDFGREPVPKGIRRKRDVVISSKL
ncbi:HotDog domain-containing protein [Fimicolochytrium jonesii]|uniref:HotDog domain-containing protein n=1 Tax=Fimicolochytrium jonesii TaxID=1396493 RepID=UPI0022FF20E9|nr:HotDog domain-containing protein [Fimicolochytrium jonesii]KAI8824402.1 HotDog domain-containing protein [Fimicolochytrium jonesii]